MKKSLFTIGILFILTSTLFSQTSKTIAEGIIGTTDPIRYRIIEGEINSYFYISWQNPKYKTITDIGKVFYNLTELDSFLNRLKIISETPKDVSVKDGELAKYDFAPGIYITDRKDTKNYITISKDRVNELIEALTPYK